MKAVAQDEYGPPDVLELKEIDTPEVGDDDVLVRVHAAAVHPGDYFVMTGVPYVLRLAFGLRGPRSGVLGLDVAGHVEVVGKNVSRIQPGDEVFGWSTGGTLAEYACAGEDNFATKPTNLTMEQAAAIPVSGIAALQALRDIGKVQPGQNVLITGASGGVGTFAVQIAKSFGAEVTGVCSTRNLELVRSIGADHVIDYTHSDFTTNGELYDVILDNVEAQSLSDCRRRAHRDPHTQQRFRRRLGWTPRSHRQGAPAVALHSPDAAALLLEREPRRPCRAEGTHRGRQGHAGHRQDLPAQPGR